MRRVTRESIGLYNNTDNRAEHQEGQDASSRPRRPTSCFQDRDLLLPNDLVIVENVFIFASYCFVHSQGPGNLF
jgi:hypothetical protein